MSEIIPNEIVKGDYIKVLVQDDDEYFALVLSNEGNYLFVTYLFPIGKSYKSALVYSFETKAERVDFESILEHHDGGIELKKLDKNMYVFSENIDPESDSEIEDMEDYESDDDSFVVSDTEEMCELPPDAKELDESWNKWSPKTPSAKRFKKTVEQLEATVKIEGDNLKFVSE